MLGATRLDDPSVLHHQHAIGEVVDDAEIMGDEEKRRTEGGLQFGKQDREPVPAQKPSSALTGSSATRSRGRGAKARAIATRWRCRRKAPADDGGDRPTPG
ncbi:hypothetical protein [Rhizobium sp. 3T7]|uniref:hypothetical protein n=1 Tax=Rhizobium sp. 3T7 TaxID=2874922 RepID=UPI00296226A0|nr:hypothetical protein [Rhizobium sp. 3T7]